jgi:hypothetical protein
MKRAILVCLMLVGVLSVLMACGNSSVDTVRQDSVFFPQKQRTEGGAQESTLDLLDGQLILVGSCLRVEAPETDQTYLPVWPPDYTLHT